MLELSAEDAFSWKTETIAIEPKRPFQVVHSDGNDSDSRFHLRFFREA